LSYFALAPQEGARIAAGGTALAGPGGGHYVAPTLFTDARADMRIAQEEIFGPVLTAMTFRDEAQAIEIANGVRYGLAGYLWTENLQRALRVADAIDVGMIWVNSENVRHLPAPFGGTKMSGIGRDGGDYSFEFYMETKNVALATTQHAIPKLGLG
jgi:5-carboxymethyl-2-hydroxymuconic-semialdehyde dehydrogenase